MCETHEVGVAAIYRATQCAPCRCKLRTRELEKTQEQLLATTEAGELQRREDARARRLATAREVRQPVHGALEESLSRHSLGFCFV